jgi:hypothetical protein
MEPALATGDQAMADMPVGVDTRRKQARAHLSLGRPREVHRQGCKKHDADEHSSPSPTWLLRRLLVRICRQTR